MDRGVWRTIVHRVAKSQTQLSKCWMDELNVYLNYKLLPDFGNHGCQKWVAWIKEMWSVIQVRSKHFEISRSSWLFWEVFWGVFPLDSGDLGYQQATLYYMQYLDICILSFCDKFFWLNTVAWSTLGKLVVEILKQYLSFPCYQSLNLIALCKHISFLQHEVKAESLETELGCKIIER